MERVLEKTQKHSCARGRARDSAVSQAFFASKTQGRFPFGGQATRGDSLCGCVCILEIEPQGGFPFVGMSQGRFPCVGVFRILEIELQGGFPFVGMVRGELARGIPLCECGVCVKVCKFYAGHAHELFEILCGGCLKKFLKVSKSF